MCVHCPRKSSKRPNVNFFVSPLKRECPSPAPNWSIWLAECGWWWRRPRRERKGRIWGRKEGGDLHWGGSVNSPRGASPPPSSSPPQFILLPILYLQKQWAILNTRFCIFIALYLRLNTHVLHEQNLPCSISCLAAMTRENFAMLIAIKHVLSFAHFWYSSRVTHTPHPSKIRKYQSQVVRNTVRNFGEIQLEKYSKIRGEVIQIFVTDVEECTRRGKIAYSCSWMHCLVLQCSKYIKLRCS